MRRWQGSVGVAIPSIPPRRLLLGRALMSVATQSHTADRVSVVVDAHGYGAAAARNAAWEPLDTEWVAFLDDDDEFLPHHLDLLLETAIDQDADMVHSWFEVVGGTDPFLANRGRQFDLSSPHQTTITCLWRRNVLDAVGGFRQPPGGVDGEGHAAGEDFDIVIRAAQAGAKIVGLRDITWRWHHHRANTMGLPSRWTQED